MSDFGHEALGSVGKAGSEVSEHISCHLPSFPFVCFPPSRTLSALYRVLASRCTYQLPSIVTWAFVFTKMAEANDHQYFEDAFWTYEADIQRVTRGKPSLMTNQKRTDLPLDSSEGSSASALEAPEL